jgi:hypothetical protein
VAELQRKGFGALSGESELLLRKSVVFRTECEDIGRAGGDLAGEDGDLAGAGGDLAGVRGDLAGVRGDLAGVRGDLARVRRDPHRSRRDLRALCGSFLCCARMSFLTIESARQVGALRRPGRYRSRF